MRGKVFDLPKQTFQDRITPAYAGKSTPIHFPVAIGKDHPRLCGEKVQSMCFFTSNCGITPAYAGKRQSWQAASFACGDHPRLCGEKNGCLQISGSGSGITPAYAGKSH